MELNCWYCQEPLDQSSHAVPLNEYAGDPRLAHPECHHAAATSRGQETPPEK